MFEGSFSHALADYLSIQTLLKENNRRSCIWDKPGLGFSDYLYTDLKSYMTFYDNMINGFGETGSYSFVGWGGGGEIIYEYASKYPQKVTALTFLDSTPNGIEFDIPRILKNWSQSQYDEYKSSEIGSRFRLFSLINGLGVPWGLMSLLTPSSQSETFYNRFSEQIRWSFLTEKSWITQGILFKWNIL
jgi:pimeloyl-ACP methyl ester carboxylesterase